MAMIGGGGVINEAEANIVRRVFTAYVSGRSPMKIVESLNAERVRVAASGTCRRSSDPQSGGTDF
jgi:hypothetical protein